MNVLIETLEPRRLLSVKLHDDGPDVFGTPSDDRIVLSQNSHHQFVININGHVHVFQRHTFGYIWVFAGAGDDRVEVKDAKVALGINVAIYGDEGDDLLIAGQGGNQLYGGSG